MLTWLTNTNKKFLITSAVMFIFLVSLLDGYTGYSFRVTFLYIFPVLLVSWFINNKFGIIISLISASIWFFVNVNHLPEAINLRIHYWNAFSLLFTLLIISNIMANLKIKDEEAAFAQKDTLTGALNIRGLKQVFQSLVQRKLLEKTFSVIFFDLDNFKQVNDKLGHKEGDRVLKLVGNVIKESIRDLDIFARVGGDEFFLVFPGMAEKTAKKRILLVKKLLLKEMKYNEWPVTFSMGIVTFYKRPKAIDEIIKIADETMYRAKNGGKNRIVAKTYKI